MKKILLLITLSLLSKIAIAESCDYIDCESRIGYVYLPNEVIRGYQLKDNVSMNGQKYQLSSKDQFPFKEIGLPEVGSIVTVSNNYTSFYRNSSIEFISDALSKHRNIEYDKERKIAEVNAFYNPAFQMTVGAKLKILGYKNFNYKGIQDKLFVQIQYISDK